MAFNEELSLELRRIVFGKEEETSQNKKEANREINISDEEDELFRMLEMKFEELFPTSDDTEEDGEADN